MDGEPTPRMNTLPTDAPSVACQVRFGTAVARSRAVRRARSRNSSPDRALTDAGVAWTRRAVTVTSSSRGVAGAQAAPSNASAAKARPAIERALPLVLALDISVAPILPQDVRL